MEKSSNVLIDGNHLDLQTFLAVVEGERAKLSEEAILAIETSYQRLCRALQSGKIIYGVNTGFGDLCTEYISPEDIKRLQLNLLRSHAAGVGPALDTKTVRGILLLRANALAKGYSGVRLTVVETLLAMLNQNVHPVIPAQGSLGASGDLAPLAHMSLVLVGEGEAQFQGKRVSGREAMSQAGIAPLSLEAKEGLALINGTQVMTALGALTLLEAETLLHLADLAAACTLEVSRGRTVGYHPAIQSVRPHPGQIHCAENLRRFVKGSQILDVHSDRPQDAYVLRCAPQIHGAIYDALSYIRKTIEIEMNAVTDNPLVFEDDILSGGNFHGQPIALALDHLSLALCTLSNVSERRIERLVNQKLSGLPAFLAPNPSNKPGLDSGYMIAHYSAAALALENRQLANPSSVHSLPVSANQEDHISNGVCAARNAAQIVKNTKRVLATELLCAIQAFDLLPLDQKKPGIGLSYVYETLRKEIPPLKEDRAPAPDVEKICELIDSGLLTPLSLISMGNSSSTPEKFL